jgi:hypothetical protein
MMLAALPPADIAFPPPPPVPMLDDAPQYAIDDPSKKVKEALGYLIRTATPGYTMVRQGPDIALGRLHPAFVVKLQEAIQKARAQGLVHCGVFSAYRPPAFGVGGFSDKFNSMHSYGLAVDMAGIGGPGSAQAHLWQRIVTSVGLFLPYGPDNRSEFNHTQLVQTHIAAKALRTTITATKPKDVMVMWRASGIKDFITNGKEN